MGLEDDWKKIRKNLSNIIKKKDPHEVRTFFMEAAAQGEIELMARAVEDFSLAITRYNEAAEREEAENKYKAAMPYNPTASQDSLSTTSDKVDKEQFMHDAMDGIYHVMLENRQTFALEEMLVGAKKEAVKIPGRDFRKPNPMRALCNLSGYNSKDSQGRTPLQHALELGNSSALEAMLSYDLNEIAGQSSNLRPFDIQGLMKGKSLILYAIEKHHTPAAINSLMKYADLDATEKIQTELTEKLRELQKSTSQEELIHWKKLVDDVFLHNPKSKDWTIVTTLKKEIEERMEVLKERKSSIKEVSGKLSKKLATHRDEKGNWSDKGRDSWLSKKVPENVMNHMKDLDALIDALDQFIPEGETKLRTQLDEVQKEYNDTLNSIKESTTFGRTLLDMLNDVVKALNKGLELAGWNERFSKFESQERKAKHDHQSRTKEILEKGEDHLYQGSFSEAVKSARNSHTGRESSR